jgi:hypothetical protein
MTKHQELETKHNLLRSQVTKLINTLSILGHTGDRILLSVRNKGVSINESIGLDLEDILPYELDAYREFLRVLLARYESEADDLQRKLAAVEELLGEVT